MAAMPGAYGSCWMRTPSRRYSGASAVDMATWPFRRRAETGRGRAGQAGERHAPTEVIAEERRTTSEGVTIRAETTAGIGGARGSASNARRIRRRGARRARDEKVRSWHVSTTLARAIAFASGFTRRRARSASCETNVMASGSAALGAILEKVGSSDKGA